jgi:hypothetical protein
MEALARHYFINTEMNSSNSTTIPTATTTSSLPHSPVYRQPAESNSFIVIETPPSSNSSDNYPSSPQDSLLGSLWFKRTAKEKRLIFILLVLFSAVFFLYFNNLGPFFSSGLFVEAHPLRSEYDLLAVADRDTHSYDSIQSLDERTAEWQVIAS